MIYEMANFGKFLPKVRSNRHVLGSQIWQASYVGAPLAPQVGADPSARASTASLESSAKALDACSAAWQALTTHRWMGTSAEASLRPA